MTSATTCMLFSPPHPPFQLPGDGPVVLGRSRSCAVRLLGGDASRRHAEIVPVEGGFAIRDLGSTNGTFVNGERTEERRLRPGDRIEIGSSTITFCQVDATQQGDDDPGRETGRGDDKTILRERPVPTDVFRGELAEIPAFAVLQILELGRKTGVLRIDSEQVVGELWFDAGIPVHAVTKQQAGFDAALAIGNGVSGRFTFEPRSALPEPTIKASVTEILLEASRLLDEGLGDEGLGDEGDAA